MADTTHWASRIRPGVTNTPVHIVKGTRLPVTLCGWDVQAQGWDIWTAKPPAHMICSACKAATPYA